MIKSMVIAALVYCLASCGVPGGAKLTNETLQHSFEQSYRPDSYLTEITSGREGLALSNQSSIVSTRNFQHSPAIVAALLFNTEQSAAIDQDKQTACLEKALTLNLFSLDDANQLFVKHDQLIENNLRVVTFGRRVEQTEVAQAYLECRYVKKSKAWFLYEIKNETRFEMPQSSRFGLSVRSDRDLVDAAIEIESASDVLVPRGGELVRLRKLELASAQGPATVVVDPTTGELIQSRARRLSAVNHLSAEVFERSYLDQGRYRTILPLTALHRASGVSFTSHDGAFLAGEIIEKVSLESERVSLYYGSDVGPVVLDDLGLQDRLLMVGSKESEQLATNAYTAVHRINKFVREFLSEDEVPFIGDNIEVRINQAGSCNAYYTTIQAIITLFAAGNGCANIAGVNDVIYHEWGHGLDDHTGRSKGVTDNAFSEGIGDFLAAFYNDDPLIGIGFVQDSHNGIRTVRNTLRFPDDTGDSHVEGGIIAGAFWDLYLALQERYGKTLGKNLAGRFFFKHLLLTDSYLESYEAVLLLDDDDQNPATQSPNYCLINAAFAAHGLTAAQDCDDRLVQLPPVETGISVALVDSSGGSLGLVAASDKTWPLYLCFSARKHCLQNASLHRPLTYLNRNDQLMFYKLDGALPSNRTRMITVLSKDAAGTVRSSRSVKVVSK